MPKEFNDLFINLKIVLCVVVNKNTYTGKLESLCKLV